MPENKDPLFRVGHRKRLGQKVMDNKATQYELLEFWLTKAIYRRDVRPLSRLLMQTFGSYHQVLAAPRERLMEIEGVGPKVIEVLEALRQSSEIDCGERIAAQPIYKSETALANYCKSKVCGKPVEEFHAIYLDDKDRMIADDLHTRGDFDNVNVYPRVVLARALFLRATSVLIYHNHPNETACFSEADIDCTQKISAKLAGENIALYDHLLIAGAKVLSIRNTMYMNRSDWF